MSSSVTAFVVSDIRLNGLQRVPAGTVFRALPVTVGDDVDSRTISNAARALFRTRYFQDVELGRDGDALIVTVVERPTIGKITIKGNDSIATEDLTQGLQSSGLVEGGIFERGTLENIRMELERQYVAQGRYSAKIEAEVEPLPQNRVDLVVRIKEGKAAKIKGITIVGNTLFDDDTLLNLFKLKPSHWSSWYSNDDRYSREKLAADLEQLRSHYLDSGYLNFDISSVQVAISPDKEGLYITLSLDEGDQFTVNSVKLAGEIPVDQAPFKKLITVKENQIFSRRLVTETEEALTRSLGVHGFAFARVTAVPEPAGAKGRVNITFLIEPKNRTSVRRINFSGNTRTQDEVLRREMRQMEGGVSNSEQIEQSTVRLNRLGFFREVNVERTPVPGSDDLVDLNYSVEELPSGTVTASIGFSQSVGLILGGSLSQDNFMGSGNRVDLTLNRSDTRQQYNFAFNNPYYTIDGVSRGFNLYYSASNFDSSDITNYSVDTFGGDMSVSYPLSEISRLRFGGGVEKNALSSGELPAFEVGQFLRNEGNEFVNLKGSIGWVQSALNHGLLPTRGWSQSLTLQSTLPGSDLLFYKLGYSGQRFWGLPGGLSLRASGQLGYGGPIGSTTDLPFYENYYGGGFSSVRGYRDNTLGPRSLRGSNYDPVGGDVLVEGSVAVLFPLPFIKDQRTLRSSLFFDVGNVFSTDCSSSIDVESGLPVTVNCFRPSIDNLRYSVGVGLTWITPIGPLTFSLAKALKVEEYDEPQIFQFSVGTPF